jgi:competence protein ComEC
VIAGEEPGVGVASEPCTHGLEWTWNGVAFRFLQPATPAAGPRNDRSCVLRVAAGAETLLLTGDIEAAVEARLVAEHADALAATVLQVPHHGSTTSSSAAFIDTVAPRLALVSSGHGNRFGLPNPEVVARYRERGIALADTARRGALEVRLGGSGHAPRVHGARERARRFWHTP